MSEDGPTLLDDNPESGPTVRDAAGNIIDVVRGGQPVTGARMGVGAPGFPAAGREAGPSTA